MIDTRIESDHYARMAEDCSRPDEHTEDRYVIQWSAADNRLGFYDWGDCVTYYRMVRSHDKTAQLFGVDWDGECNLQGLTEEEFEQMLEAS